MVSAHHNSNLNSYNIAVNNKKNTVYTNNNNKNRKLVKVLLKNNIIRLSIYKNQLKTSLNFTHNIPRYKKISYYKDANKYTFK
jgi:hypothetical protein